MDSISLIIAGAFGALLGIVAGFLLCLAYARHRERRAADEAWRMATTFNSHKSGKPTRL